MVTHKITEIICDAAVQVISGTSVRIVRNIHIYSIKKRLFWQPLKQLFLALLTNIQNVLQICQMTQNNRAQLFSVWLYGAVKVRCFETEAMTVY